MHKEEFRKFSNVPYLLGFFKVTYSVIPRYYLYLIPREVWGYLFKQKDI